MNKETTTASDNRFVLGMNLDDLSLRDIKEEISDISRDINCIVDYEAKLITYSEFRRECSADPKDKQKLIDAKEALRIEVRRRNDGF